MMRENMRTAAFVLVMAATTLTACGSGELQPGDKVEAVMMGHGASPQVGLIQGEFAGADGDTARITIKDADFRTTMINPLKEKLKKDATIEVPSKIVYRHVEGGSDRREQILAAHDGFTSLDHKLEENAVDEVRDEAQQLIEELETLGLEPLPRRAEYKVLHEEIYEHITRQTEGRGAIHRMTAIYAVSRVKSDEVFPRIEKALNENGHLESLRQALGKGILVKEWSTAGHYKWGRYLLDSDMDSEERVPVTAQVAEALKIMRTVCIDVANRLARDRQLGSPQERRGFVKRHVTRCVNFLTDDGRTLAEDLELEQVFEELTDRRVEQA